MDLIISTYIETLKSAPVQRSAEWYDIRKKTFGGSEMSTILGNNPFNNIKSLIAEKVGINKFNGNLATRWGTIFEDVTCTYTRHILKMDNKIHEVGSVEGYFNRQRYSPDGLGAVKLLDCDDAITEYIILFEFKSPSGSLPNKKIPTHYVPQIQTGLLSIPIADYAIFVNNAYRKCKLSDIKTNGYDMEFHKADINKRKNGLVNEIPYAYGTICFYSSNDTNFINILAELTESTDHID